MQPRNYAKKCQIILSIDKFRKQYNKKTNRISYETNCLDCDKAIFKEKYYEDVEASREKANNWGKSNRDKINKRAKEKRKSDPAYKLRGIVSGSINTMLKKNKSTKSGRSILEFLPYTFEELKAHIESLFEYWMTWENWNKYNKTTWNDNDTSSWTWSLDHIIPQSELPFTSMKDENFLKCWSLSNLRPLNAKVNLFEGTNRTRHENKKKGRKNKV